MASFRDQVDYVYTRMYPRQRLTLWVLCLGVLWLAIFAQPFIIHFGHNLADLVTIFILFSTAGIAIFPLPFYMWVAEVDLPRKIIFSYLLWFVFLWLIGFPYDQAERYWMVIFFGPQILFFGTATFLCTFSLFSLFGLLSLWIAFCQILHFLGLLPKETFHQLLPVGRYQAGLPTWRVTGLLILAGVLWGTLASPATVWLPTFFSSLTEILTLSKGLLPS